MSHQNNRIVRYFISVVAALIIIALLLSSFIYSFVNTSPDEAAVILETSDNGTASVDPGNAEPDSLPYVPKPTTPPPSE